VEWLDEDSDPALQRRSHRDIALANRLFGGTRAVEQELLRWLPAAGSVVSLLDVGTGTGDIPERMRKQARARDVELRVFGLDDRFELVRATRDWPVGGVVGNALSLPFVKGAFDFVIASQLLHHFTGDDALIVIREMNRVAKRRVIIADLRRNWVAVAGLWLVSFPLGFHQVSRHDGVVSILRGFQAPELRDLVRQATGVDPMVKHQPGWRLTASWDPDGDGTGTLETR
jgi:SAM-dependent methyltransferase